MPNEQDFLQKTQEENFQEIIRIYWEAAAAALGSITKADVQVYEPVIEQMELRQVEYTLLEPALFVKSCLTSRAAGTLLLIFRERDIQIFLNKLMGIDELASPDFVFDEIAMSAASEMMNQMLHSAVRSTAEYLCNTMASSDCTLTESDGSGSLAAVMGEQADTKVHVLTCRMKIDGVIESELKQILSTEAVESLEDEIVSRQKMLKQIQEEAEQEKMKVTAADTDSRMPAREVTGPGKVPVPETGGDVYHSGNMGLIMNVPLNVTVEIGRARRKLKEVLGFDNGTVVELEKQADAPVDIIVNGQLIARGNVVVIDDNFGVRITEIVNKTNIFGNGELN